jgi:hypothetical protein
MIYNRFAAKSDTHLGWSVPEAQAKFLASLRASWPLVAADHPKGKFSLASN